MIATVSQSMMLADDDTSIELDKSTHRLIDEMMTAGEHRAGRTNKLDQIASVVLHIACVHPMQIVRQLSLIDAHIWSMSNRSMRHMTENTSNLQLFTHILRILAALRPHLYAAACSATLERIFRFFFEMCQRHFLRNKHHIGLVNDTLELFAGYVDADPMHGRRLIETHSMLLQAAAVRYPDLVTPRSLLEVIGVSVHDLDNDALDILGDNELRPAPGVRPPSPFRLATLATCLRRLALTDSWADEADALAELNSLTSGAKTDGIRYVLAQLESRFVHPDAQVRKLALSMCSRFAYERPTYAAHICESLMTALRQSNDAETAHDAVEQLSMLAATAFVGNTDIRPNLFETLFECTSRMPTNSSHAIDAAISAIHINNTSSI